MFIPVFPKKKKESNRENSLNLIVKIQYAEKHFQKKKIKNYWFSEKKILYFFIFFFFKNKEKKSKNALKYSEKKFFILFHDV